MAALIPQGLLAGILDKTPMAGLGISPALTQNEIIIELSESQLREMLLAGADERAKSSVSVELKDKKMVLKIRLF